MRAMRTGAIALTALALAMPMQDADARGGGHWRGGHHHHGHGGFGLGLGLGLLVAAPLIYAASGPRYVEPAPVYRSAPVYVERSYEPAPSSGYSDDYWYYCERPRGYYPYIRECPGGWMRVVPDAPR